MNKIIIIGGDDTNKDVQRAEKCSYGLATGFRVVTTLFNNLLVSEVGQGSRMIVSKDSIHKSFDTKEDYKIWLKKNLT